MMQIFLNGLKNSVIAQKKTKNYPQSIVNKKYIFTFAARFK
jgi:hypothetical protein